MKFVRLERLDVDPVEMEIRKAVKEYADEEMKSAGEEHHWSNWVFTVEKGADKYFVVFENPEVIYSLEDLEDWLQSDPKWEGKVFVQGAKRINEAYDSRPELDLEGEQELAAHKRSLKRDSIKVGDEVMYSRNWLRSTGNLTGPLPLAKGKVVSIEPLSGNTKLATVQWDTKAAPRRVLIANLIKKSERHLESV